MFSIINNDKNVDNIKYNVLKEKVRDDEFCFGWILKSVIKWIKWNDNLDVNIKIY